MSLATGKSAFLEGFIAGVPFLFVAGPFAFLFGVVAVETGLDIPQSVGMSLVVIAGAAQFTAVQLLSEAAPIWVAMAAALAVNLRMAMYSASLQPHLGSAPLWQRVIVSYLNFDISFALGIAHFEERPERPTDQKVVYFLGTIALTAPFWVVGTLIGAAAGGALPDSALIDFAMPILFLAIVGPMLKTLAHLATAVSSAIAAMLLFWLPTGIGLLIAAAIAMAVGAEIERRRGR